MNFQVDEYRRHGRSLIVLTMLALLTTGCGDFMELWAAEQEPMANLTGSWSVRGRGDRSGCEDDLYDGPFSLRLASAIDVVQSATTETDIDRLLLEESEEQNGARLSLTGAVLGHRVDFTLREEVAGSPTVELRFTGIWYPVSETIEGDFTSDGPMGCYSSGDLTVTVSRARSGLSGFPYE